jgi:NAD+ diphosphatase
MTDRAVHTFVPQTMPPADRAAAAYWFAFQDQRMIVRTAGSTVEVPLLPDLAALGLSPIRWQYLGYLEDGRTRPTHCYSAEIDPNAALSDGLVAEGLRDLYAPLGDMLFNLAGRAVQIVTWDRTNQYCGQCGAPTEALTEERARRCQSCGLTSYPRISPAIIIAIVRRDEHGDRILLARNHRFPPGRYSVVAGFVEPGESLEACAHREVLEEVGIRIKNVRYFGSQPWPFPNSLMVGFTAEHEGGEIRLEESELADARWFAADELPNLPPRMTIARKLIDWFVGKERGSDKVHQEPGAS